MSEDSSAELSPPDTSGPRNPLGRQAAAVGNMFRFPRMVGIFRLTAPASHPEPQAPDPPTTLCPEGQASRPRVRSP